MGSSVACVRLVRCVWLSAAMGVVLLGSPAAGDGEGSDGERREMRPVLDRERINNNDWTVLLRLQLRGVRDIFRDIRENDFVSDGRIDIEGGVLVLPVGSDSGYADVLAGGEVSGKIELSGLGRGRFAREVRVREGYQAGQRLAAFDIYGLDEATSLRAEAEFRIVSYETDIDEDRARRLGWPDSWPDDPAVRTALLPQLFVESDDEKVVAFVEAVTKGEPRRVRPYVLAKFLAKSVLDRYELIEQRADIVRGRQYGRVGAGRSEGYLVRGAAAALRNGGGSPYDLSNLLCAVYRAAGLPARVVIGLDQRSATEPERPGVIAWVEFYLAHPGTGTGEWIPVDIVRQRGFSSRAPDIDRKWEYFGKNDDSDFYCPVSFHWHPPTAVANAGPPALWGWTVETESGELPAVLQRVSIFATATPVDPGDREAVRERNERKRGGG